MSSSEDNLLSNYVKKRNPDTTPEPFGGSVIPGGSVFVVHQHAASHDHFDLRLEIDGVLWSWAVPKGPSADPSIKRLAIAVEQHPLDYINFEGMIPEGNYGAGAMIVWDRGRWVSHGDPLAGFKKGKLLFDLQGFKLHGKWTLVKTQRGKSHWLLIKEHDGWVRPAEDDGYDDRSVLSGLTVETLADPRKLQAIASRTLKRIGARSEIVDPKAVKPMLCTRSEPFSHPEWIYEVKYDGYRVIASKEGDTAALRSRNGHDLGVAFPDVINAISWLPVDRAVFDGELVVHDATGRPDFSLLQTRAQLGTEFAVRRAALQLPASLYLFDLLGLVGLDLRNLTLRHRKRWLRRLLPNAGVLRFVDDVAEHGQALFEEASKMRLEGIVAKRADSTYEGRRSEHWLKIPALKTSEFLLIGYRIAKGTERPASIHVARYNGGRLAYRGRVGSGLGSDSIECLRLLVHEHALAQPPCTVSDSSRLDFWCSPEQVVEVTYKSLTRAGRLRQPVFVALSTDFNPTECEDQPDPLLLVEPAETGMATPPFSPTNPTKIFWPQQGYTKHDLIAYYEEISPWLLPYLWQRPLVLTRYPDGVDGKNFFQKDAPPFVPSWMQTVSVWSDAGGREIRYLLANDVESLRYIINLGAIPLHVWSSRVESLDKPDYCIIDLDPKQAPFAHVLEIASAIRALCESLALPHFLKTSGATGLHVLIPLHGQLSYTHSRLLAELIARVVLNDLGEIGTVARSLKARDSKVYVDCLQNGYGKTIVAPFAVRPLDRAPVSMPLRWRELKRGLTSDKYTIRSAPRRMRAMAGDPMLEVLTSKPDLVSALDSLGSLIAQ